MLLLYYGIGKRLSEKIASEKWGAKVIEKISLDIQQEFPGIKGFSTKISRTCVNFMMNIIS